MCLGGKSNDGPVDPGTYAQWLGRKNSDARMKGEEYNESPESRNEYQKELSAWNATQTPDKEEVAVEEKKKEVAKEIEEDKEEETEKEIAKITQPISTLPKDAPKKVKAKISKKDIVMSGVPVEDTTPKPPARDDSTNILEELSEEPEIKTVEPIAKAEEPISASVSSLIATGEAGDSIKKKSKRRSGKGRRSLITGRSGGGIGYYNKYFT